jgi:hypothetical protein
MKARSIAVPFEGSVTVYLFGQFSNIVDTSNDIILGASAIVDDATGDFTFLTDPSPNEFVTLNQFYYQGPNLTLPKDILWQGQTSSPAAGKLVATALTIGVVNEGSNSQGELLTLVGVGKIQGAGFDETNIEWMLEVAETTGIVGTFRLTALPPQGGGGTGSTPSPEPGAALLFGVGLLVVARSIRRA